MSTYDFKMLNDKEFEALCTDLLTVVHGARFERFKAGRDGGIDGRYFTTNSSQVILQCKHWARTGIAALLKSLTDVEFPKVQTLHPSRYILATSLELSPTNKTAIRMVFGAYMQNDSDVLGMEDLNQILSANPEIERRHYKLWLSSTAILDTISNAAILGRSNFTLAEIREKASRYVLTSNHENAVKKLEELGSVLITGEPGIGKTTLAEQLCLNYVLEDFQLCVLGQSVEEAEAIYAQDRKQIFHFDDFLGRNYLSALSRHEDSEIVRFIMRVGKDKLKRFVLTSRSTVLNHGKRLSDLFGIAKIDRNEMEIHVSSLDELTRAKMLHAHLWYSALSPQYFQEIIKERRYRKIISHKNFNPRLVQFITDAQRVDQVRPENYWTYIEQKFSNPADIWAHVYDGQLDDYCRLILRLLVLNGSNLDGADLRSAYYSALQHPASMGYVGSSDFERNLQTVVGSVINRTIDEDHRVTFSLFNPSIADYVLQRVRADVPSLNQGFLSLTTVASLSNFKALKTNGIVRVNDARQLATELISSKLSDSTLHLPYRTVLAEIATSLVLDIDSVRLQLRSFLAGVVVPDKFTRTDVLASVSAACLKEGLVDESRVCELDFSCAIFNAQDLQAIVDLGEALTEKELQTSFQEKCRRVILDYWYENIEEEITDSAVLDGYLPGDSSKAHTALKDAISSTVSNFGIELTYSELGRIASRIDVESILKDNADDDEEDGERTRIKIGDYYREETARAEQVDDLFSVDMPETEA
jgi:nucleoside-triphosphatase THEP1